MPIYFLTDCLMCEKAYNVGGGVVLLYVTGPSVRAV
jgi:hypothetical protein